MCRKSGKGAAEWYGKDLRRREINADDQVKKRGKSRKSVYEKGRRDKTKIKEVEENWKSVEMERVAEKCSYWTRAMARLQQLAPDVTMKLLIKTYQNIYKFTRAA